jgi:hypothetical protein
MATRYGTGAGKGVLAPSRRAVDHRQRVREARHGGDQPLEAAVEQPPEHQAPVRPCPQLRHPDGGVRRGQEGRVGDRLAGAAAELDQRQAGQVPTIYSFEPADAILRE